MKLSPSIDQINNKVQLSVNLFIQPLQHLLHLLHLGRQAVDHQHLEVKKHHQQLPRKSKKAGSCVETMPRNAASLTTIASAPSHLATLKETFKNVEEPNSNGLHLIAMASKHTGHAFMLSHPRSTCFNPNNLCTWSSKNILSDPTCLSRRRPRRPIDPSHLADSHFLCAVVSRGASSKNQQETTVVTI